MDAMRKSGLLRAVVCAAAGIIIVGLITGEWIKATIILTTIAIISELFIHKRKSE